MLAAVSLALALVANAPLTLEARRTVLAVDPSGASLLYPPAAAAFREKTRLELITPQATNLDPKKIAACPNKQRFQCWVKLVSELSARPNYLLVLGAEPLPKETRMTALFVDLSAATAAGNKEELILETAVDAVAGIARSSAPADLRFFFDYLITEKISARLAKKQEIPPFGWLEIENIPANLSVLVDERELGKSTAPRTVVEGLTKDRYQVNIIDRSTRAVYFQGEILPLAGRPVRVTAGNPIVPSPTPVHQVLFWSGTAAAGAGVILTAVALSAEDRVEPFRICTANACRGEGGDRFTSFSDLGREPGFAANSGGFPIAPLGIALLGAGATWSIGALLADPERAPWIELALGTVLGGAAFTAMVALD